jgi:predicted  nucleic acid-binding Zn-ribbon protein
MTRWGFDQEERAACTKKAHDAYAVARQALEKAAAADARAVEATTEATELRGEIAALRRRVAEVEQTLDEAMAPRRVKPTTRKAA